MIVLIKPHIKIKSRKPIYDLTNKDIKKWILCHSKLGDIVITTESEKDFKILKKYADVTVEGEESDEEAK